MSKCLGIKVLPPSQLKLDRYEFFSCEQIFMEMLPRPHASLVVPLGNETLTHCKGNSHGNQELVESRESAW